MTFTGVRFLRRASLAAYISCERPSIGVAFLQVGALQAFSHGQVPLILVGASSGPAFLTGGCSVTFTCERLRKVSSRQVFDCARAEQLIRVYPQCRTNGNGNCLT